VLTSKPTSRNGCATTTPSHDPHTAGALHDEQEVILVERRDDVDRRRERPQDATRPASPPPLRSADEEDVTTPKSGCRSSRHDGA
jgi:hypothetical protein